MVVQPDYRKTRHETKASDDKERKEKVLNIRGQDVRERNKEKEKKIHPEVVNNLN
jgi:hypothetical protein